MVLCEEHSADTPSTAGALLAQHTEELLHESACVDVVSSEAVVYSRHWDIVTWISFLFASQQRSIVVDLQRGPPSPWEWRN